MSPFQAGNSPNNPLVLLNAILTDSNGDIARVSDTRAVYAAPTFDYIITSPTDPVRPNHIAEFDITVRNLSGAMDSAGIYFTGTGVYYLCRERSSGRIAR